MRWVTIGTCPFSPIELDYVCNKEKLECTYVHAAEQVESDEMYISDSHVRGLMLTTADEGIDLYIYSCSPTTKPRGIIHTE